MPPLGHPRFGDFRTPVVSLSVLAVLLLLAAPAAFAAEEPSVPKPAGYVSDTAGVMGEWAAKTETLCGEIERRTTSEIAVLTVKTTAPLEAQQYAQQVFDRWKIGKKGKDNGVLILVAVDDRKMWIATGYGVEGVLPDGKVGDPRQGSSTLFRQSRYGEGSSRAPSRRICSPAARWTRRRGEEEKGRLSLAGSYPLPPVRRVHPHPRIFSDFFRDPPRRAEEATWRFEEDPAAEASAGRVRGSAAASRAGAARGRLSRRIIARTIVNVSMNQTEGKMNKKILIGWWS
jgi:hypothetical protein